MKKGITLIAVLAAVLAVTSGAFAAANHYLITSSSQIKDGAVSAADLSPAARNALQGEKGNTGAAGRQGLAGAQGLKGDTGATGAQGSKGDTGATGAQGPKGSAATSGYEVRTWRYTKDDAQLGRGSRVRRCRQRRDRHGRLLPRQGRAEWRLPVHVGR